MNLCKLNVESNKSPSEFEHFPEIDLKLTEKDVNDNNILQAESESSIKVNLTNEDNTLKIDLILILNKIENVINELNLRVKEFSILQYEHFADIKREIDIKREMKIQEIYTKSEVNTKEIEILNKSSCELIKQVEKLEEDFKSNFENHIKAKLVDLDIEMEKKTLKNFLSDPSLSKKNLENLKTQFDSKLKSFQKKFQAFDLFEFDLKRNKFITTNTENLGKLDAFDNFINFVDIVDIIGCFSNSNQIFSLNVNKNCTNARFVAHTKGIFSLIPYQKDKLFSGGYDGTIKQLDSITGECLKTLEGHSLSVTCLKVLTNGNLASSSNGGCIKVWDLTNFICICTFNESSDADVECLDQLSNENLISGSDNGILGIYDLKIQKCVKIIEDRPNWIKSLRAFPQNDLFSTGGKTIKIWNFSCGECIKVLRGHTGLVCGLEFTLNNLLISCSWDKTVRVWDLNDYSCIHQFLGHSDKVTCLKLSVNKSNLFYSASEDKTLKVWDLNSKTCLQTIQIDQETKPLILSCINPCFFLNEF